MEALQTTCQDGVNLVCVMAANNEVGTIYPIEEVVELANKAGARTLVDATQAVGKFSIQAQAWGITYLTVSAHKIYGPKGVGALITSPGVDVRPSNGPVPGTSDGTPSVPGIAGLGEACRLRRLQMALDELRVAAQRDRPETLLLQAIDGLVVNRDRAHRLSNNLNVSLPGVPNDAVIARLRPHVALSSGAACSSYAQSPSHVLRAMGLSDDL